MTWKVVSVAGALVLALAVVQGCGGGGKGAKKSSANRTPPADYTKNEWIEVAAGTYTCGDEKYPNYPPRKYKVPAFSIQKYEVTNEQYRRWLETLPPEQREEHMPKPDPVTLKGGWTDGWYEEGGENLPVTNINLLSAIAYAESIGAKIPGRVQWEVAARGPDARVYPWGNTYREGLANFANPTGGKMPVGSFPDGKSWCGAMDMAGNVWEWTLSWFDENAKKAKLLKGGCYFDADVTVLEGANSLAAEPHKHDMTWGFRCIK